MSERLRELQAFAEAEREESCGKIGSLKIWITIDIDRRRCRQTLQFIPGLF
jgi:hypothetical protein